TLLRTGVQAMRERPTTGPETPSREITAVVAPRSQTLIDDYIRHVGGSTSAYRGVVPPHLFPQWGFPLIARTLDDIPYDLTKVLNGGVRMEINADIPVGEPLHLSACLEKIDDNGSRAVLTQRLTTGTASEPEALVSYLYAIVPIKKKGEKKKKTQKERARVPVEDREIGAWKLGPKAGFEFAVLTGDFNPIHWVPPYAKMAGFKSTILHGFATLARAIETLNTNVWSGDRRRLKTVDVRFVKPLLLPNRVNVFHGPGRFSVGDAPGGPAYLTGEYTSENPNNE
ncbi:MAG: MaoC/PaaZ C-terminal domain-containing protein, partial [Myxococcota bacterium]